MTPRRYFTLILILGTLTALGPFSIDMYLPGFPAIAQDLKTSVAQVALTLSSFFIGISAGQLLYGPLLDRFGRKKPLYLGLVVYIISSVACAMATSIDALIILRLIQAVGSCAAGVASVAMVRDLFPVKDSAKVFSLLMLVVGVSPMIAPTVGGYVTAEIGWQAVFIILALMGTGILLAVFVGLPESSPPDASISLKPKPIIFNFLAVLKERQFVTYVLAGAASFAALLTYVSGSPLLFMEIHQVNEKQYGWIFAFLSVGLIGASQVNSILLKKYRSPQIILAALLCQAILGIILVMGILNDVFSLYLTIMVIFFFLCCAGFSMPNASALAMAPFTKNAGSASAIMGATQMGIGALATITLSLFKAQSAVPMAGIMAIAAIIAFCILLFGQKSITSIPLPDSTPDIVGSIH